MRISARATREIAKADTLLVSPVSCWEIASLVRLGRIKLDREIYRWISDLFDEERFELGNLSASAAVDAALLPEDFPSDPADRFLYAQARELAAHFVSKDDRIREYAGEGGDVRVVW